MTVYEVTPAVVAFIEDHEDALEISVGVELGGVVDQGSK